MSLFIARDALESVKLAPTASALWQRLSALVHALKPDAQRDLIQEISCLEFELPVSQWLQCSALAYLTRQPGWLAQQAALADESTAPDAILALTNLAWHQALVQSTNHTAFVETLIGVNLVRLQRLVANALPTLTRTRRSSASSSRLRVAIYTPQVANSRHGGTAFALNVLSLLSSQAVEATIFAAQETSIPAIESYCGSSEWVAPALLEHETLQHRGAGSFQIKLASSEVSLRLRFAQLLDGIHANSPDVVVFVGLMSPLLYCLYPHYPVVGLSVHALAPAVPLDVWLSSSEAAETPIWPELAAPTLAHFPFRFWPTDSAEPMARASVGLPAAAVVLVTVGYRLDAEINGLWGDQMRSLLDLHADLHWLLVGVSDGDQADHVPQHPHIHRVAPQLHLEPWLAMCDIYVNPPRMGGGGSVAMAMEKGLAVASFSGSDGGDKVGPYAVDTVAAYVALVKAWVLNPMLRREVGDALRKRFNSRLDLSSPRASESLIEACHQAISIFNQRHKVAND